MFNQWSSLAHTLITGSLGYILIIFLLRVSGKRTLSKWNSFDFVVTIAFGSILAAMLLSKTTSLAQAGLGFGLLVLYQFGITWIAARSEVSLLGSAVAPPNLRNIGAFRRFVSYQGQ